jgi:hypothetical protein
VSIEGQRARKGSGPPASDRPQRWGTLVTGVWTQRFARTWYVVTGLVPARIEVRPSNGLGSIHPDLESQDALAQVNDKQAPATESWITT